MTADPATTLANVASQHFPISSVRESRMRCSCNSWEDVFFDRVSENQAKRAHAAHVVQHQLSVLSATHAIIELPEPLGDDGVNVAWKYASMWHDQDVVTAPVPSGIRDMTPEKARAVAADLLAAARRADE